MYEPKSTHQKIIGAINILPVKTKVEIQRVLSVYEISLETFNQNAPEAISLG